MNKRLNSWIKSKIEEKLNDNNNKNTKNNEKIKPVLNGNDNKQKRLTINEMDMCNEAFKRLNHDNPSRINIFDPRIALKYVDFKLCQSISEQVIFKYAVDRDSKEE